MPTKSLNSAQGSRLLSPPREFLLVSWPWDRAGLRPGAGVGRGAPQALRTESTQAPSAGGGQGPAGRGGRAEVGRGPAGSTPGVGRPPAMERGGKSIPGALSLAAWTFRCSPGLGSLSWGCLGRWGCSCPNRRARPALRLCGSALAACEKVKAFLVFCFLALDLK